MPESERMPRRSRIVRNVVVTPVVIFCHAPLMLGLGLLVRLGDLADAARDWVHSHIPGWTR